MLKRGRMIEYVSISLAYFVVKSWYTIHWESLCTLKSLNESYIKTKKGYLSYFYTLSMMDIAHCSHACHAEESLHKIVPKGSNTVSTSNNSCFIASVPATLAPPVEPTEWEVEVPGFSAHPTLLLYFLYSWSSLPWGTTHWAQTMKRSPSGNDAQL